MNLKDRLIRKLLDFGKKHRLMVYPALALVAVISAISHVVCWGKGNGKRVVASVTVVALLITQSLFLTSSAAGEELPETPDIVSEGDVVTENVVSDAGQENPDSGIEPTDSVGSDELAAEDANVQLAAGEDVEADTAPESDDIDDIDGDDASGLDMLEAVNEVSAENSQIQLYAATGSIQVEYYLVEGSSATKKTTKPTSIEDGKATINFDAASLAVSIFGSTEIADSDFEITAYSDATCTQQLTSPVVVDVNDLTNNTYRIYACATRKQYRVNVYNEAGGATVIAQDIVAVPSPVLGVMNPTVNYTVKNASDYQAVDGNATYKKGWVFKGLAYNGRHEIGDSYSISTNVPTAIRMDAIYEASNVNIEYVAGSEADISAGIVTPGSPMQATHLSSSGFTFPGIDSSFATPNESFYFVGWEINGNVYTAGSTLTANEFLALFDWADDRYADPNVKTLKPVAKWARKDAKLLSTSPYIKVSEDGQSATIEAEYNDQIISGQAELKVVYKDGTPGTHFASSVSNAPDATMYGVVSEAYSDAGGCSFYTNGNTKITRVTPGPIEYELHVVDSSVTPEQTYIFKLYLNLQPKTVSIDESTVTDPYGNRITKIYDGTAMATVADTIKIKDEIKDGDIVNFTYTSAEYDSPNAGTRDIVLNGVQLTGADKDNYRVGEGGSRVVIKGAGTITPRPMEVVMQLKAGQQDTVKFGEPTPQYELVLSADSLSILSGNSNLSAAKAAYDASHDTFMRNYLGFSEYSTSRRIYSPKGSYDIYANFDESERNYVALGGTIRKTFTVTRDSGLTEYVLNGDLVNGYYKGLSISPTNGYTEIRRLKDGEGDVTEGASITWQKSLNIEDMKNGTIRFQMKAPSGAITEIVILNNISVDTTGPELKSVSATTNSSIGEYIREYGFGSYYHTQNSIESVAVTLSYTSQPSACTYLYYYFVDEKGNKSGETKVPFSAGKVGDYYVATINIGTAADQRGELIVYAENEATNTSARNKIKLSEFTNDTDRNYYEWMVENNISAAEIKVTDADGSDAVTNTVNPDLWYNSLLLSVLAADSESGVHSIKWMLQTPGSEGVVEWYQEAEASSSMAVNKTNYGKVYQYNFQQSIGGVDMPAGLYTVSAILEDNAGNTVSLEAKGPYNVDTKAPEIDVDAIEIPDIYLSGIDLSFAVTEGEGESGIASVELFKVETNGDVSIDKWIPNAEIEEEQYELDCAYKITENGKYKIVAIDRAGNVSTAERTFDKVSTTIPDAPVINIEGVEGNNNWYKGEEIPRVTIDYSTLTSDGVEVDTYYKIIVPTGSREESIRNGVASSDSTASYSFDLTEQGTVTVEAWSVSEAGIKSPVATKEIQVDTVAPTIEIVNAEVDSNGNLCINFRAKDSTSGIDSRKVLLNGSAVEVTEEASAVVGSFVVDAAKSYTLIVEDYAGNVSESLDFKSLGLITSPVIDITKNSAYVEARIIEGTYDVSDYYIAYKKRGDTSYRTALFNDERNGEVIDLSCNFRGLESNTVYDYRISASNEKGEVRTYNGSFRTLSTTAVGSVYGNVIYADSVIGKEYPVYVSLYDANTVVASMKLSSPEESAYLFTNIVDGAYRVVATNGILTETAAVTIDHGAITYPKDYALNGGVTLVLNGYNTSVVIEDNAISITADNLESMYDNSVYKGILTERDIQVINEGGSVNISLHASYLDVSDVSPDEQSVFDAKLNRNVKIERYINLYVLKEVKNAAGEYVNGTPVRVPELYNPITISFPLGDLAGQQIYVASVHGEGSNYSFMNWANADDVTISQNYVTITTRYFSVYALYRLLGSEKTYTVAWKDGDGRTMKTETVVEGKAATPPTQIPTKAATEKYTYVFSGWDTDYSKITKDTIIAARFTAQLKNNNNNSNDNNNNNNNNGNSDIGDVGDKNNNTTPPDGGSNANTPTATTPNSYTYLGSADSPRTGDGAPIGLLAVVMLLSGAGVVVLKKKSQS